MKSVLMLAALVALPPASASERLAHESLMDEIERQVRLPKQANPLKDYGRYYAFDGKGRVEAVYLLAPEPRTPDPLPADWGCEEVVMPGNEVTARKIPCPPEPDISHSVRAGQRRWVADRKALPVIFDGGCMIVNVIFDLKTRTVERAFCNGYA